MLRPIRDLATAFQFLTRLPLAWLGYEPDALSRAAVYFPLVGLVIGAAAFGLFVLLSAHLPALIAALATVLFTVLISGGLHEDGLADAADAFGGGWNREQVLEILKDSRVGSYGALAVVFSVASRAALIAALPRNLLAASIISAHVLSRWTILPLGFALPAARKEASQGARLTGQTSPLSLAIGTLFSFAIAAYFFRSATWAPLAAVLVVTALSGLYYHCRIGGIAGDCFGTTIQLAEIAVYVCGVWR